MCCTSDGNTQSYDIIPLGLKKTNKSLVLPKMTVSQDNFHYKNLERKKIRKEKNCLKIYLLHEIMGRWRVGGTGRPRSLSLFIHARQEARRQTLDLQPSPALCTSRH